MSSAKSFSQRFASSPFIRSALHSSFGNWTLFVFTNWLNYNWTSESLFQTEPVNSCGSSSPGNERSCTELSLGKPLLSKYLCSSILLCSGFWLLLLKLLRSSKTMDRYRNNWIKVTRESAALNWRNPNLISGKVVTVFSHCIDAVDSRTCSGFPRFVARTKACMC